MKLPFGKHKDKEITDIPSNYLEWLREQDWFVENYSKLYKEVEEEYNIRERSYAHFF